MAASAEIGGWASTRALARVTLLRATRGRSLWIALVVAMLPAVVAAVQAVGGAPPALAWPRVFSVGMAALALIPPLLVAGAIGDDLDDRTVAYLWSRPLPRWSLVTGVVLAMAPVAALALALGLGGAFAVTWGGDAPALARVIAAAALGAVASSAASAALAAWNPRFGTALAVTYLLIVDAGLAQVPAALCELSIRFQVTEIAGALAAEPGSDAGSGSAGVAALVLVVITAVWTAIAMRRVGRVE